MHRWLLALALCGCKEREAPRAADPPNPASPAAATPAARPRPELALADAEVAPGFDHEPVDPAWQAETERALERELPGAKIECRRTQCRITIMAGEGELAAASESSASCRAARATSCSRRPNRPATAGSRCMRSPGSIVPTSELRASSRSADSA
jgi:hypothetical protein